MNLLPRKRVPCNGHAMREVGSSCEAQAVRHIQTGSIAVGLKAE
jgi:hypothetical protein